MNSFVGEDSAVRGWFLRLIMFLLVIVMVDLRSGDDGCVVSVLARLEWMVLVRVITVLVLDT